MVDAGTHWWGPFQVREVNPKSLVPKKAVVFVWITETDFILADAKGQTLVTCPRDQARVDIQSDYYGRLGLGKNSVWVNSGGGQPLRAVSNFLVGLTMPSPESLTDPVVVFSYPGRTQEDAAALFSQHAAELAPYRYRPISQSWGEGQPGVGRVLTLGIMALALRPNGFLTVTYKRDGTEAQAPVTADGLADRLRKLDEARRLGLITGDEYAVQRQRILDSA